jgi:hypothetical protein
MDLSAYLEACRRAHRACREEEQRAADHLARVVARNWPSPAGERIGAARITRAVAAYREACEASASAALALTRAEARAELAADPTGGVL